MGDIKHNFNHDFPVLKRGISTFSVQGGPLMLFYPNVGCYIKCILTDLKGWHIEYAIHKCLI